MAARTRDQATKTREEATRRRLLARAESPAPSFWQELLELDRVASQQSREAATQDRDAAALDRTAADKDRDAAERDRTAAGRDREAADKDREAAEKDRAAADADRAADSDRAEADQELVVAQGHLTETERQALLGRMAAELAHEINNPLAALLTSVASMRAFSSPELAPMLADAEQAAARISDVVVELRAWLSGTGTAAEREVIDFTSLIRSALQFTPEVERAALVTVELLPTGSILGWASRLSLVISSLLTNAAQAIAGPRDDNRISLRLHEEAGMAYFEVVDTGCGIAPSVLPHIFEPLFTTHEGKGSRGLGLALCRRIVTDLGGFLSVETEVGVGTKLLVRLPCAQQPAVLPAPGAPHATVLLIDDDLVLSRSLGRLLATRCTGTFAHNGAHLRVWWRHHERGRSVSRIGAEYGDRQALRHSSTLRAGRGSRCTTNQRLTRAETKPSHQVSSKEDALNTHLLASSLRISSVKRSMSLARTERSSAMKNVLSVLALLVSVVITACGPTVCSGTSCSCPGNQQCAFDTCSSSTASCNFACAAGSTCTGSCGANCNVDCAGTSCTHTVGAGSNVTCSGGTCNITCESSCNATTAGSATLKLTCKGTATAAGCT